MTGKPLTPQKNPLLKYLRAPRQNLMVTELISQLRMSRAQGGGQTGRRAGRR
jgi:hypothetical protein